MFLSCDWGTSGFRLKLVDSANFIVLAEETSADGIAATHTLWQKSNQPEDRKIAFYLDVLKKHIGTLEKKANTSLAGVPIIISGMASSTIGFINISYTELPVNVKASNISTVTIAAGDQFDHDLLVISGITANDDVIRGEETQLIGCAAMTPGNIDNELFIFPGTHSKHIHIINNGIKSIRTYMTGEFFDLLSQKSILKNSVEKSDVSGNPNHTEKFNAGVYEALNANLLNIAFKVRTNSLFDKYTHKENYHYLSGLLIGSEIKELTHQAIKKITLVGGKLGDLYSHALQQLAIPARIETFDAARADEAVIRGQYNIYKQS